MFKKAVSIFFTVLFLGIISAPSIIASIDDSIDISILFSLCEEEEETKNLELVVSENEEDLNFLYTAIEYNISGYRYNNYPKPHLNLISPPPDYNIS